MMTHIHTSTGPRQSGNRVLAMDVCRGLTILLMVFANSTSRILDLPWWMDHSFNNPQHNLHIAWLDFIFPMFLFIMGAAIPLAMTSRLSRGESIPSLLMHIVIRAALLIWIGTAVHAYWYRSRTTGHSVEFWYFWGGVFTIGLLSTHRLVKGDRKRKLFGWGIRVVSAAYLVWASVVLRAGPEAGGFFDGGYVPLKAFASYSTYEGGFPASILGYLGFAYLVVAPSWLLLRRSRPAQFLLLVGMFGLMHHLQEPGAFLSVWFGDVIAYLDVGTRFGYHASIVLAGVMFGELFLGAPSRAELRKKMLVMSLAYLVVAGLAGADFYQTFAPASIRRTLVFIGMSCLGFWIIWEMCLRFESGRWFCRLIAPLTAMGKNPLFAYMLGYGLAGLLAMILNSASVAGMVDRVFGISHAILWVSPGYIRFGPSKVTATTEWWTVGWSAVMILAIPYTVLCTCLTMLANRLKIVVKL